MSRLIIFFGCFVFSIHTFGAQVLKIKEQKILISLQGLATKQGDILLVIDATASEIARVSIIQVKNDRALGQILSGTPQVNAYLIKYRTSNVLSEDFLEEESNVVAKGWYLGIGYNTARPKLEGKGFVVSSGETVDFSLEYSSSVAFNVGYESAYLNSLGFIFLFSLEQQRSLATFNVSPGYSMKDKINEAKVSSSFIDLGLTYGFKVAQRSVYTSVGVSKAALTFSLPGVSDISGGEVGVFAGLATVFARHYQMNLNYRLVHKAEESGGKKVEFDFSGVSAGLAYLF